jgi:hypothetical protein
MRRQPTAFLLVSASPPNRPTTQDAKTMKRIPNAPQVGPPPPGDATLCVRRTSYQEERETPDVLGA